MTYGQRAVGLTFNPPGDAQVQKIKELYAAIIDLCNLGRTAAVPYGDQARLYSIAITEAEAAYLHAVWAATWRDE